MKKLTLSVLTILALASCTKEYVAPVHASNDGVEPYVPAVYEGTWNRHSKADLSDTLMPVSLTRQNIFTDTLDWNMRAEQGYVLDTNGVDTYVFTFPHMMRDFMRMELTNLIDGSTSTIYFTK
jgi:hypothetical protein